MLLASFPECRSSFPAVFLLLVSAVCCGDARGQSSDDVLRSLLQKHGIVTPDAGGGHSAAQIELGQALFFDRELSGNRDTSCATCHHPQLSTVDALSLPVGTGPLNPGSLGLDRIKGLDREFVPRNAPEIFNRGSVLWTSMFWDSRVAENADGTFRSPAGAQLLPNLDTVLAIQAMFPVTSRDEMRGRAGDLTFEGDVNEIALVDDNDLHGIWSALVDRLMAIPAYRDLFQAAWPGIPLSDITFAEAASSIAAFETSAFSFFDSPFDQYLQGDNAALTEQQKRGAILFYGAANCVACHAGPLMTDQRHWSLAVPQLGTGKADFAPRDPGRYLETANPADLYAFRTPPLRNVAVTAPYMHDGAYRDLRSVLQHHATPIPALLRYRGKRHLQQEDLVDTVLTDRFTRMSLILSLDSENLSGRLKKHEINDLTAFLKSLTAPDLPARLEATIPESVPSGLPVERR
jgi:cytochrome c peroxidase